MVELLQLEVTFEVFFDTLLDLIIQVVFVPQHKNTV